jgi:hypothetical protein
MPMHVKCNAPPPNLPTLVHSSKKRKRRTEFLQAVVRPGWPRQNERIIIIIIIIREECDEVCKNLKGCQYGEKAT